MCFYDDPRRSKRFFLELIHVTRNMSKSTSEDVCFGNPSGPRRLTSDVQSTFYSSYSALIDNPGSFYAPTFVSVRWDWDRFGDV